MKDHKGTQELSAKEKRRKRRVKNQIIAYSVTSVVFILCIAGFIFGGKSLLDYNAEKKEKQQLEEQSAQEASTAAEEADTQVTPEETETEVVEEADLLEELINTYIAEMTIEEKVAGLFMIEPEAITGVSTAIKAGEGTKTALEKFPVGGMIYFAKNIQSQSQLKEMISNTVSYSKYPLFIGVDEEGGKVNRLAGSALKIDKVEAMGEIGKTNEPQKAKAAAVTISTYLKEYGFNVDFAPVGDVLTNEKNPIGDRSFGEDAQNVSEMVASFVEGMQNGGVSACVKHFPGHGSTAQDSHEGIAKTEKTLEEMRQTEFLPFKAGIDAGVDFVMVGHISAPNVVGDETPSSLSSMMVTEVLRNELGYQGIVVTDAMNMKAITDKYKADEAAILALQAGVDMIMMPQDFELAYNGILQAITDGKLTKERIEESLHRIYRIKYKSALEEAGKSNEIEPSLEATPEEAASEEE